MSLSTLQKSESIHQADRTLSKSGQSGGIATLQFQDNRPESSVIQQVRESGDHSVNSKKISQLKAVAKSGTASFPVQKKANKTGLPDNLKFGMEQLSGYAMDDVKVHYNSSKPAQLQAHAYAQGTDIHVAPGQEKHLAHEAWHVVQQKQGRVHATKQLKGEVAVNDDTGLENEADVMGAKSLALGKTVTEQTDLIPSSKTVQPRLIQLYTYGKGTTRNVTVTGKGSKTRTFEECTYNFVEFKKGEKKPSTGTVTGTAAWEGWLKNKKGLNNATQLHIVNKRWGGLGGKNDGNIVPGTPAENSHHLHEGEKLFDKCFNSSDAAINDCKYECSASPKYPTAVDVSGGDKAYGDPTLTVKITDNGSATIYPITDGADGLIFTTGS